MNAVRQRSEYRRTGSLEGWVWRIVVNLLVLLHLGVPVTPRPENARTWNKPRNAKPPCGGFG
jgi:hypothetical protein